MSVQPGGVTTVQDGTSADSVVRARAAVRAVIPNLSVFVPGPGTSVTVRDRPASAVVELTLSAADGMPALHLEVDLGAASAYWHPGHRTERVLTPDWAGEGETSLVQSAPVGALYDAAGRVLLGWAAGELIAELSVRCGVSEERKAFVVEVRPVRPLDTDLVVMLDGSGDGLAPTVQRLGRWLSAGYVDESLTPPAMARVPVYSTWYSFTQDIDAETVLAESGLATDLGCAAVFIDDGWQRFGHGRGYQGCGDWIPDESKFADLPTTVKQIQGMGAAVGLWIAPLLLGRQSEAVRELSGFAPQWDPLLACQVLDPRHPEVRDYVERTCLRLVTDYGVDLLKIDFLDRAMIYQDTTGEGDLADIGQAMARMLQGVRRRLAAAGRDDVAFEFRQPYVSPAIAAYGEILRANDCPGDSVVNRICTLDARMLSVGRVVHADPMMWGIAGGAEAVAQQLYGGWFAVPQISMRLAELDQGQTDALRGLLMLWRSLAEVTLDGTLEVLGGERGYDLVRAVRSDLDRSVVARYSHCVVDLDKRPTAHTTVMNATTDHRVVVRTSRPIIGGVIRSAAAAEVGTVGELGLGLVEIEVPAFGSVTLLRSGR